MDFYTFTDFSVFTWLWLPVLGAVALGAWTVRRSRRAVRLFHSAGDRPVPVRYGMRWARIAGAAAGVGLLVLALAGPRWDPRAVEQVQMGRDIVVLLDVSASMACMDMKPSRLTQAKTAIEGLVRQLEGDRVALVAFAGAPRLICPLTTDYGYFLTVLRDVDVNTVQRGGTLIGDALHYAADNVFPAEGKAYRDAILITDGEDHGSFPEKAAEIVHAKKNIRLHIIGLGDSVTGAKVPVYDQFGKFREYRSYKGQFVYSRLDEKNQNTLLAMAVSTDGTWLPAETKSFDLARLYREKIYPAARRETASRTSVEYSEGYQVFILAGLVLITAMLYLPERRA
ncbi:MAG: VWA domain-containing protein [Planctomycetota bacterium]